MGLIDNVGESIIMLKESIGLFSLAENMRNSELAASSDARRVNLVSVLIRTYNRPGPLQHAIESVCAQTYRNIEVVLVNDGGKDVSNIVEPFRKYLPLTCAIHDHNRGYAAAANTAIRNAEGIYALFLDDHDRILDQHIETLVDVANRSPQHGVIYSDSWMLQAEESERDTAELGRSLYSWEFDLADLLLMRRCFSNNSALFRVDLAKETLFDESLKAAADWDFWARMALKTRFLHVRKTSAEFHAGSRGWTDLTNTSIRMLSKYPERTVNVPISTIAYLVQQRFQMDFLRKEYGREYPPVGMPSIPPLDVSDMKVRFVRAQIENQIPRNQLVGAEVTLENCGNSILLGGNSERSVHVSYHWLDPQGHVVVWDGERSDLPVSGLMPRENVTMSAQVMAPDKPGMYILQFAVVQEGVSWFPKFDSMNHLDQQISVL